MRDVWLTAKYEAHTTLVRKSFWFTTFLLPAAILLLVLLTQLLTPGEGSQTTIPGLDEGMKPMGYVDSGGLLRTAPAGLPRGLVRSYGDEQQAQASLARAEIDRYYLIPQDYVASGRLTVVETRYQPLRALEGTDLMAYVINTGLTGDERLAGLLLDPTPRLESLALAPTGAQAPDSPAASYFLPYMLMFILYMALAMTSGFMLQSVSKEKENRTAEILLVSVKPRDLMLGKIAGLSAVGLLQVVVWLAVFFGVVLGRGSIGGVDLNVGGAIAAQAIPWTLGYFLLGYLMYASVYAVLGVLAPTARDANQFVFVAIIPLIVPLLLSGTFSDAPNGVLATTLSLVPLTAPIAMVARMGATIVPWWQSLAGLLALGVSSYLCALLAGRLFRAENLLSSRALTWSRLAGAWSTRGAPTLPAAESEATGRTVGESVGRGQPGRGAPRKQTDVSSRRRLFTMALVAGVMVVVGAVELARGESNGKILLSAGVVVGALAYWRHRRG